MSRSRILIFVVGRVLATSVTVLGFAFNIAGASWLNISSNHWGWIGLIAFVAFATLTGFREASWRLEQRPNITVSPEVHGERSRLIVRNTGGPGDFTARGRVRASSPEPELYTMYWESMTGVSNHIDGDGGTGSIVVAEKSQAKVYVSDAVEKSYSKGDLVLFKAGEDGMERFPVFSGKSRRIVEGEDERTVYTYVERCIVEVAITATPSLRKKWGTNRYLCEIKDGELKLCETDLLVPDVSE